jgi:hypothetical protein
VFAPYAYGVATDQNVCPQNDEHANQDANDDSATTKKKQKKQKREKKEKKKHLIHKWVRIRMIRQEEGEERSAYLEMLVGTCFEKCSDDFVVSFVTGNVKWSVMITIQLIYFNTILFEQKLHYVQVVVRGCPVKGGVSAIVTHVDVILVIL